MRVESIRDFFEEKGGQVRIASPVRNAASVPGVIRYNGILELLWIIWKENPDVLIGSSPPMTHSAIGMTFAKLLGKRVFVDVRDPWMYAAIGLNIYKKNEWKALLYRWLEKTGYALSEKVFSVSSDVGEYIMQDGVKADRIVIAPNGTLPKVFRLNPAAREKIRKKLGIKKDQPTVLYAGDSNGLGLESLWPQLLAAIRRNKGFLVLLVPVRESDSDAKKMEAECKKILKENVAIVDVPPLELKEVAEYFAACDIGIAVNPPVLDYCIPAKVYDYAGAGLYTVGFGTKGRGLENLLDKNDMGSFAFDQKSFETALEKALKRIQTESGIKKRLNALAVSRFDRARTSEIIWKEVAKK
ncbi:MAG: glycosyltransferase [Candidatus Micrarchaeota archaeon]